MRPGTRIFLVEDEESIARFVELELEHRNFRVRLAHDGLSALEGVCRYRPDLVIPDIMLLKLDGVGVLGRIRRSGNRVPIIMLTARNAVLDKVHSLNPGPAASVFL